jgi:hypothetical protein
MLLPGGVTVLPGTAIGFRNDNLAGIYLFDNSSLTAQGTPTKPIVFTDNTLVQEGPFAPGQVYNQYVDTRWASGLANYGGPAFFVPAPYVNDNWDAAPVVNMRFCNFYMTHDDYGLAAGQTRPNGISYFPYAPSYAFSFASSVSWNMQDCNVEGGQITLGDQDGSTNNPPGWLAWTNNSFDETFVLLQPSSNAGTNTPAVALPFDACNNLFKEGTLAIDPIVSSQGNWQMANNLFDREQFWQNSGSPLDYTYNGYWTNAALYHLLIGPVTNRLTSTTTGDGTTDGTSEQFLTNIPPYQNGPFGKYYLTPGTMLAGAGSTTADQLGFYHYTTATNQAAQSNSVVDIGLHYLSASNGPSGWIPLDTDGDGVPDYVEDMTGNGTTGAAAVSANETDWLNPSTYSDTNGNPIPDAYSATYAGQDIAGAGLMGAVAAALSINPITLTNPLTLTQIVTGNEPNVVVFELPLNYNLVTNIGNLQLWVDGVIPPGQICEPAADGNSLLIWNAAYTGWNQAGSLPDWHFLQARFDLTSIPQNALNPLFTFAAQGPALSINLPNSIQFNEAYSSYNTSSAVLYANLQYTNATYTITLIDRASSNTIDAISGTTDTGSIQESWGVTNSDGSPYSGAGVNAMFNVTFPGPGSSATASLQLFQLADVNQDDGNILVTCAWDDYDYATVSALETAVQLGVVDNVLNWWDPSLNYDSPAVDAPSSGGLGGLCGYLPAQTNADAVLPDFSGDTRNFFFEGHGQDTTLGNDIPPGNPNSVAINLGTLKGLLQNGWFGGVPDPQPLPAFWKADHPYRFVFLDACHTAESPAWSETFGIPRLITYNDLAVGQRPVQAFVGWKGAPRAPDNPTDWYNYSETLGFIYDGWMSGSALVNILSMASKPDPYGDGSLILPWPLGLKYTTWQVMPPFWWMKPAHSNAFWWQIYGYPGITRTGYL